MSKKKDQSVEIIQGGGKAALFGLPSGQTQSAKKKGDFAGTDAKIDNKFFSSIISSLTHPFYVISAKDHSLVIANDAALQGRKLGDITCYNICHKNDKPCAGADHECTLEIIKRTKKPVIVKHTHYDKNGQATYVDVYAYPIFDKLGDVSHMVEYSIDVSEKEKMEMQLKSREAIFKTVFENMKSCMIIYEPINNGADFKIININKAVEKLEKITKEYAIGKPVTEVFKGVRDFGLFKVFQRVNETGITENFPSALYKDARISSWRNNDVFKLASGEIVAIYQDVTEEKKQSEALDRQNKFLTNIISSLSYPFYVVNARDYSLAIANEAALQGRGLEGMTCYNISHKSNKPCETPDHGCTLEIVKRTKKQASLEHIHHDKDGSQKYVEVQGYPVFDDQGEVVQMIEYCVDISERKKIAMELEEKNKINMKILENAPFGIYIVNKQGGIDFVNQAMIEISGTPREHFFGLNMFEHEFYKKIGLSDAIKNIFSGQSFRMDSVKYTSQIAKKMTVRNFIGMPFGDKNQKKALIFVEDITQITKTKEDMQKRVEELEKFNRVVVDREIRMVELKNKIRELEKKQDKN